VYVCNVSSYLVETALAIDRPAVHREISIAEEHHPTGTTRTGISDKGDAGDGQHKDEPKARERCGALETLALVSITIQLRRGKERG